MSVLWYVFGGNVWPHNPSRHYSIPIDFIAVSSSPAGNAASVGFTSRDAHRAMFPSPRQENFYSLKGQRNTSARLPRVSCVLPVGTFKISPLRRVKVFSQLWQKWGDLKTCGVQ